MIIVNDNKKYDIELKMEVEKFNWK